MARQNLFDQGRAGARHAEHEDGVARVVADGLAFGKEFRREQGDAFVDEIADIPRLITVGLAAQGIAGLIVGERLRIGLAILKRLAKRKIEVQAVGIA